MLFLLLGDFLGGVSLTLLNKSLKLSCAMLGCAAMDNDTFSTSLSFKSGSEPKVERGGL
jgi:hypothetical protein